MAVSLTANIKAFNKNIIQSKPVDMKKIRHRFTLIQLDALISFLYKDSVLRTKKTLTNIKKVIDNLDYDIYKDNPDLIARLWIISKTVNIKLSLSITDDEYIKQMILDDPDANETVQNIIYDINMRSIGYDESKHLIKQIDDILQYSYIITVGEGMKEILTGIVDGNDFKSYQTYENQLYDIASFMVSTKRKISSAGASKTFALDDDIFNPVVDESIQALQDKNKILLTGIQGLNILLSPGYLAKRLYTFLALPGKGKSTILLKSAIDIKKYNKDIETKDPDKRPAVVMLILENDIPETIERLYNMTVGSEDIRNLTPKQIKRKLRTEGGLKVTTDDPIDIIIKEYKNRELDTNDIYSIIQDLEDDGIETIGLVVDYIKRLRPAEAGKDEKQELKNISNELKELSKFFDIPVITAQQINRAGSGIIEAALAANKEDATKLLGTDTVAGAWEIIENSDVVIIVNPSLKRDTDEMYMTFKLIKRRYKGLETDEHLQRLNYINHPFERGNGIRLIDDIYMAQPLYIESLTSDYNANGDNRGEHNAVDNRQRRKKKKTIGESFSIDDFDPFTFDKA